MKTWIGASINLIDEIEKVLLDASKRVIEITFLDRNDTKFAVCNPERCLKLVNVSKTGSGPWLSWTSRLDDSGGKLELKRIEKSDNQRDIQVRIILSSLKSDIGSEKIDLPLRILVDSFQGKLYFAKKQIIGLYEPIARCEWELVKRMSEFAKMTMLPRELAYIKVYLFFNTVIGRSLRMPNTVFRILVDVAVTWRFIHGIKTYVWITRSKISLSNLMLQ